MGYNRPILSFSIVLVTCLALAWFILEPTPSIPTVTKANPVYSAQQMLKKLPHGQAILDLYEDSLAEPEKTFQALTKLKEQIDFTREPLYLAFLYRIEANIWLMKGNLGKSVTYGRKLLILGENSGDLWMQAQAKLDIAIGHVKQGAMKKAEPLLHKAIALAKQINERSVQVTAYNVLGIIHTIEGEMVRAQSYYHQGIDAGSDVSENRLLAQIYGNISLLYTQMTDWQQALNYVEKAIELYDEQEMQDPDTISVQYLTLTMVRTQFSQLDLAEQAYSKYLELSKNSLSNRVRMRAEYVHAQLLYAQNKTEQAFETMNRCLNNPEATKFKLELGLCQRIIGQLEMNTGKLEQAQVSLLNALENFTALRNEIDVIHTLNMLAKVSEMQGDYQRAYHYLADYQQHDKKYREKEKEERLEMEEINFFSHQQQNELALLRAEKYLAEARTAQEEIRTNLFLVLGLIVLATMLYQLYQMRKIRGVNQELSNTNVELSREATEDALTGLHNRRYLENFLQNVQTQDQKHDSRFTLALLDLDHFKSINDRYGHSVGDEVLKETSRRLNHAIRRGDLLVRWGGEEFLCFMEHGDASPTALIERLNIVINKAPFTTSIGPVDVTASIGAVSGASQKSLINNWQQYLSAADELLYEAKSNGRNQFFHRYI
ncbi:diguanylate cyclase [Vibrio sp. SCSIO 43136]|uniref:tetratricopeptide repeat-containing diguanylate cyclase n=1 Tax=Vibrio sp. SCSIO 43136 TaxID=2819101 RepID=UPI002075A21F|nr:diguanylate cyclase [Vibrio sp. SCSIO 43136]USD68069.1 diguanylate cyclase [Vibrio sp. SCSIO 43136]